MQMAERIVMIALVLTMISGGVWFYVAVQGEQDSVREAVLSRQYEIKTATSTVVAEEDWRTIFPFVTPMRIDDVVVQASIADSLPERIKGLSDTPFMPDDVVKLFVFGQPGEHSIWMKDMNYPLDILWLNDEGEIVHIEEQVSPDTYPQSFASPEPAWFVIEANAGFVASSSIDLGDKVVLPRG
jgi:uncharacterized membrane protein (UPF0127 family)